MILERFYSMKNKSVIIEGQKVTQGTVTDFDGNFSLNVKPGAKLKICYIGFVSQTVVAKNGDGSFTYTRETVQRQWDDKMYLFPIPNDVMLKHEKYGAKWEQNPGW